MKEVQIGVGGSRGREEVIDKYVPRKSITFFVLLLVLLAWFANELALAWIHDYVPRNVEPLPDLCFCIFPEIPEAIFITEWIMILMLVNALAIMFLHQHRWIVTRRVLFCVAFCYLCRAFCITTIQVPVPSKRTFCAPQVVNASLRVVTDRVWRTFWSVGIEQLRARELCGDLIVSGHTITIFISMMTFKQYAPKSLAFLSNFYQTLAYGALVCILLARKHYTIDVILGYTLTTRMWWAYHSLQYSYHQAEMSKNMESQSCWAWLVEVCERDAPPPHLFFNSLNWPSSYPKKVRRRFS